MGSLRRLKSDIKYKKKQKEISTLAKTKEDTKKKLQWQQQQPVARIWQNKVLLVTGGTGL